MINNREIFRIFVANYSHSVNNIEELKCWLELYIEQFCCLQWC